MCWESVLACEKRSLPAAIHDCDEPTLPTSTMTSGALGFGSARTSLM
jgi:hypothetical protein